MPTRERAAWLEPQDEGQLPTSYFLLTFTLPSQMRPFARSHQKLVYDVLFRASAEAAQRLARDSRFVGGTLGLVGVLHTWARDLSYHPHAHYLVPAGGLAEDSPTWLPARKNFLLPIKALSKLFRAKFRDALRSTDSLADIPADVGKQGWVVHFLQHVLPKGFVKVRYYGPFSPAHPQQLAALRAHLAAPRRLTCTDYCR